MSITATVPQLVELDALEVVAIVDNELDPISRCLNEHVELSGGILDISARRPLEQPDARGSNVHEFRMGDICCGAHGLSLLVTGVKGSLRRTLLFDAGPSESSWERNATRLGIDLSHVERIVLSHWHRDHSGGLLRVLEEVRRSNENTHEKANQRVVTVDVHPDRPDFRGSLIPERPIISLEADPTFEAIAEAGGDVQTSRTTHGVLDNMFLVSGEIPRRTKYEEGLKYGVRFDGATGQWIRDELMLDERFLVCKLRGKGTIVFSGCGHAGIVNSCMHAVELVPNAPVHAVIGGFHLADARGDKLELTVSDLTAFAPKVLMAGHCTGWKAKFAIEQSIPGSLVPLFVGCSYILRASQL